MSRCPVRACRQEFSPLHHSCWHCEMPAGVRVVCNVQPTGHQFYSGQIFQPVAGPDQVVPKEPVGQDLQPAGQGDGLLPSTANNLHLEKPIA